MKGTVHGALAAGWVQLFPVPPAWPPSGRAQVQAVAALCGASASTWPPGTGALSLGCSWAGMWGGVTAAVPSSWLAAAAQAVCCRAAGFYGCSRVPSLEAVLWATVFPEPRLRRGQAFEMSQGLLGSQWHLVGTPSCP